MVLKLEWKVKGADKLSLEGVEKKEKDLQFKMLPKINRLKKEKDFERVFKEGYSVREDPLFFKFAKNNLKVSRFGFVASKNFFKKATLRNKIVRRLREIVKRKLPEIKKGVDGVLMARSGIEVKSFRQVELEVEKLFKKAKIVNK